MKAFITVIGNDKVGIIYGIASVLKDVEVNILDISQTLLQNYFTMIMLVDISKCTVDFSTLSKQLGKCGEELGVSIKIQQEAIFNSMHKI